MQIGEFARICNTKISVLRHYDKLGLLKPDYIDQFTGYRYYAVEQIDVFVRISALKQAGFSLAEIKSVLSTIKNNDDVLVLFEQKKLELHKTLQNLEEAKKIILGGESMLNIVFNTSSDKTTARCTTKTDANDFRKTCKAVDDILISKGYQRISSYASYGEQFTNDIEVGCEVIKLNKEGVKLKENIDIPFENDESIVGKWETVGEYATEEDFFADFESDSWYKTIEGLYFLPNGERYWSFGWSKNKLIIETGDESYVNDFESKFYNGKRYMFIKLKSDNYRHGGNTTVLVLKQLDNNKYSASELARKDNINIPFVDDSQVIGKWTAIDFVARKEDFDPVKTNDVKWFFSSVEFMPQGEVISYYGFGKDIISGSDMQTWTKGYILRKFNSTACAYEICNINGTDYMIMEWKSGDYRWGGFDTNYYVFVRDTDS